MKTNVTSFESLSPVACIEKMFDSCADGSVTVPFFPVDSDGDENKVFHVVLKPVNNVQTIIDDYSDMYKKIEKVSPKYESKDYNSEIVSDLFDSKDLVEFWNTYIRAYSASSCIIDALLEKEDNDETLTDEEERTLNEFKHSVFDEASDRIGGVYAHLLIAEARRLACLIKLNAPDFIIENEAKQLAQALVINRCAESVSIVKQK